MSNRVHSRRFVALGCAFLCFTGLGLAGCSSSGSTPGSTDGANVHLPGAGGKNPGAGGAGNGAGGGGGIPGQPDLKSICAKLPVADAQALVHPKLPAAVPTDELGGCTFILPGNASNDANVEVDLATGSFAAGRYKDSANGTFTISGKTVGGGGPKPNVLSGVGDKAVWNSVYGHVSVSALKGAVFCGVNIPDDGTKLTIIGKAGNPLPVGTPAQQKQYADLEAKLCTDLFAIVH